MHSTVVLMGRCEQTDWLTHEWLFISLLRQQKAWEDPRLPSWSFELLPVIIITVSYFLIFLIPLSRKLFKNYIFTSAQVFDNSSKLTFFFLCIPLLLLFSSPLCFTYLFLFIPVNLYSCLPVSPLPPTPVVCAHCVVLQPFLLRRSPPQMNPK